MKKKTDIPRPDPSLFLLTVIANCLTLLLPKGGEIVDEVWRCFWLSMIVTFQFAYDKISLFLPKND